MSKLASKLKENVLNGLYTEHEMGSDLLELDLDEVLLELKSEKVDTIIKLLGDIVEQLNVGLRGQCV